MKIVIDSSVAIKLVAPENGQEAAYDLLRVYSERIAPQFIMIEAGNTLWKKVGRGELSALQARTGLEVVEDAVTQFVDNAALVPSALETAMELKHPIYDCLYLVLAERERASLVTGDMRLVRKLEATRFSKLVRPLGSPN